MRSSDFIVKFAGVNDGKERRCASIYKDSKGVIYSYGTHYPLLFQIDGKWFVNSSGYSNTTGKHIGWANYAKGLTYKVELYRTEANSSQYQNDFSKESVIEALKHQKNELRGVMASKKRKDTKVYSYLKADYEDVKAALQAVQ